MFDYDDEWMEMRAEAAAYAKERKERVLKAWLTEINYKSDEPIGYDINPFMHETKIYSTRPGSLIGLRGINVEKLKKILSDEYRSRKDWKIEFIEIRDGFFKL